ncbi:MAG: hypothetical protein N2749_01820 [Clostridia bacterium]|nr:hypothetical protein [Clostridia bacterium]
MEQNNFCFEGNLYNSIVEKMGNIINNNSKQFNVSVLINAKPIVENLTVLGSGILPAVWENIKDENKVVFVIKDMMSDEPTGRKYLILKKSI